MVAASDISSRRSPAAALIFALAVAGLADACTLGPPAGTPAPGLQPTVSNEAPAAATGRDQYIEKALSPSVPKGLEGRREVGVGSGFYVTPNTVLTNDHVAGNCAVVTVGNASDAAEQVARPLAKDPENDLELLEVNGTAEPARFAGDIARVSGQDLAVIGYPEHGMAVRQAELAPVDAFLDDFRSGAARYRFNGEVRRGNSGSPVLDDRGAVVGVVVQKVDTVAVYQRTGEVVDNIGIAIANATVTAFLRRNGVAVQPDPATVRLPPDRLLDEAHGFVRQIGCWR
jgi:serine protease Do